MAVTNRDLALQEPTWVIKRELDIIGVIETSAVGIWYVPRPEKIKSERRSRQKKLSLPS